MQDATATVVKLKIINRTGVVATKEIALGSEPVKSLPKFGEYITIADGKYTYRGKVYLRRIDRAPIEKTNAKPRFVIDIEAIEE